MKKGILPVILLSASATQGQPATTITAHKASSKPPIASFSDAHLAYTRIVLNESGWNSDADAKGILSVILRWTGGRKKADSGRYTANIKRNPIPLDYTRFTIFAAKASLRTFPVNDPWGRYVFEDRYGMTGERATEHHLQRQRKSLNTYWTSTLKADCSEPGHWKDVYPDTSWNLFEKRCVALFKMTERNMKYEQPNWCRTKDEQPAIPEYWGCDQDHPRTLKENWEELICDEPGVDCSSYSEKEDPNNGSCAKNRWYRARVYTNNNQ